EADFDAGRELLVIRNAKYGKHRLVPLHPSTVQALARHVQLQRQAHPFPASPALFVSTAGTRLLHSNIGLPFARLAERAGPKPPSRLDIADLDAPLIGAFLNQLETGRGNSTRTRNARLAAIHSLFRYAALRHPEDAAVIARVLAIPPKRFDKALITYLTEQEITALLAAADQGTWTGRRDHALLMLACQTGLRASELTGLTIGDVHLGTGAH